MAPGPRRDPGPAASLSRLVATDPASRASPFELLDQAQQAGSLQTQGHGGSRSVTAVLRKGHFQQQALEVPHGLVEPAPPHQLALGAVLGPGLGPGFAPVVRSFGPLTPSAMALSMSTSTMILPPTVRTLTALIRHLNYRYSLQLAG